MKTDLIALRNTLNQIEVKGKVNLDRLLGCIMRLDEMIAACEQEGNDGENRTE